MTGVTRSRGFTLIEMMVAVGILILIATLAIPSFQAVRQRAALRAAGEQVLSFWNQARLESAKRNQFIKVGVVETSSSAFCLGAATTTDPNDATPCDCTVAVPGANICDVGRYPATSTDWGNVTLTGVTLGGSDWPTTTAIVPAVIESKRTTLTTSTADGTITLAGPAGGKSYRLRVNVDQLGRAVLCEPTAAVDKLGDFAGRRCSP